MATEIKMPQLSDTMDSGKILNWSKKEGEQVERGDILAEVETDKANLEIESFHKGVLLKILTPADSTANVGDTIAVIGEKGESVSDSNGAQPETKKEASTEEKPADVEKGAKEATPAAEPTPPASKEAQEDETAETELSEGRIKISPLAKKLAQQKKIDLSTVKGTGPNGRIIKKDLDQHDAEDDSSGDTGHADTGQPRHAPAIVRDSRDSEPGHASRLTPLSKMRSTIARRMQQSVTEAPHFYVTTSINMGEVKKLRQALKTNAAYEGLSFNHFIIKAAARALSLETSVNSAYRDDQVYDPGHINVGVITALEGGLIIPVIKDADRLSLKDIVFETNAALQRARAGRPSSSDLQGGTFSISNMGMFDVENFTAIINPGQGAVLAVSASKEEPMVENGQIVIGLKMKATLSVDHRVIDGVMGANFLKYFKEGLEMPALLTLK